MARRPDADERMLVPDPGPRKKHDRVFITDLARYLTVTTLNLRKYAARHGFLHWAHVKDRKRGCGYWVTPEGAMRLIAHVRIQQDLKCAHYHRDVFKIKEHIALQRAKAKALKLANRSVSRSVLQSGGPERKMSTAEVVPTGSSTNRNRGNPGGVRE